MSKMTISKVAGLLGGVLITLTATGLFIWSYSFVKNTLPREDMFSGLNTAVVFIVGVFPAFITLVISLLPSNKLNAGLVVVGIFLILAGVWFTAMAYFITIGAIDMHYDKYVFLDWPYKLASSLATFIGSILLLVGGILRLVRFFSA